MKIENHSKDDHENLSPSYRNIGKNNDILSVSKIEYEHFFFSKGQMLQVISGFKYLKGL